MQALGTVAQYIAVMQDGVIVEVADIHGKSGGKRRSILSFCGRVSRAPHETFSSGRYRNIATIAAE
jgi:hypothetical protein